ncbi:Multidrug export protein EmrB [compost metagenome]
MCGYAGFFGISLLIPQWLQTQMGYTATWAGLAAAPIGLLPMFLSPLVGRYAQNFDLRMIAGLAFLAMALTCFIRASFNTEVDYWHIAMAQLIMGLGVAFFFMPILSILLSDLSPEQIADGSGLATFLRTIAGSFAASLTTWLWTHRANMHHAQLTEHISLYDPATVDALDKLGGVNQHSAAVLDHMVESQAYMISTVEYFTMLGWVFVAMLLVIWLAKPPFGAKPGAAEVANAH